MAKINILKAINEYYEERAWLAAEMANDTAEKADEVIEPICQNADPLWNCWFEAAFIYEPYCDKDADEAVDTDEVIEPVCTGFKKDRTKRAMRRKATAMHKRKMRHTVSVIWESLAKREENDMYNWSFQKQKNGDRIDNPKSQTEKANLILKKAMKEGAIPEELHDDIVKYLNWITQYCKRNIGGRLEVDRYYREREMRVKVELEEMAKANHNIFEPLTSNQTALKRNVLVA